MNKEVEKIILDIIKSQLSLPDYYDTEKNIPSIVIGFQNFKLGDVDDLQIVISNLDSIPIASNTELDVSEADPTADPPVYGTETQTVIMRETIQIELMSRNTDARTKRANILMALQSYYSLKKQETYQFKIFKIPSSFVNTGFAEGGSNLNRFTIAIVCHVWYENIIDLTEMYDSFQARVDGEGTVVNSWNNSNTYNTGDQVYYGYNNKYYECLNDDVSSVPTDTDDWTEISEPESLFDFTLD